MRINKKQKKYLIFIGIVLLAGVVIYFLNAKPLAIIVDMIGGNKVDRPLINFTTSLDNIPLNGESVILGSITGSKSYVCGSLGGTTISNSYSTNPFILTSTASEDCENWINVNGIFPKGTLEITCNLKASSNSGSQSTQSFCSANSITKTASAQQQTSGNPIEDIRTEQILINTDNTPVKIEARVKPAQSSYSESIVSIKFTSFVEPVSPPTKPTPTGFFGLLQKINDWIQNIFSKLFGLSITGLTNVEPNTMQVYPINMIVPIPDSDYSDGNISYQYGYWGVVDKNNKTLQSGEILGINGSFITNLTITTPSNPGDYMIIGVVTQSDGVYNYQTKTWTYSQENIINKEAISILNKYIVAPPTKPISGGFTQFIQSIIDFFKKLFGF